MKTFFHFNIRFLNYYIVLLFGKNSVMVIFQVAKIMLFCFLGKKFWKKSRILAFF
ncbi:hypothetical protein M083_3061 [Bacteroides fragilis str. 3986 T(B)9]|jgi:hypothetical protein|uniref:Uncharacterized protein n=1 Tax=Bacteroides fragilis str. 1007-1-F \|nr:hypothetical protein M117_3041 [Bacteroides fragilis str. 3774 T13]EXY50412.1 hypothetical protein M121_2899 [Bacteroides fragilis str. 3783N2-1]EXY59705.1 hypothetical protein M111_2857 [Bacteroides fragilis str. 3986T(B)10]EXY64718.1 hypothetical protein M085_2817 [Bacteroides fragilis str. 3986 N(B)19]EXY69335.1 hypothetical protein M083_3061 [Bacteroides fragilis str. 3986 T(B)9]EXZ09224.1 hypothetical protein M073_2901 [Bacteroides fragilis str. DS-71]EXZ38281.1 hypothetical protein M